MEKPNINISAVLAAALIQFVLGWGWYTAFVSIWLAGTGMSVEEMQGMSGGQMAFAYGGSFVAYALLYYVMAHFVSYTKSTTAKQGAQTGFWCWLGFVSTSLFVTYSYQLKPISLWLVDAGHWVVSMLIGGVLLAVWKKKQPTA